MDIKTKRWPDMMNYVYNIYYIDIDNIDCTDIDNIDCTDTITFLCLLGYIHIIPFIKLKDITNTEVSGSHLP